MTKPNKYTIGRAFCLGFSAALAHESRTDSSDTHWLAGYDAGYEMRKERARLFNEYLLSIGEQPMGSVRTA
jgi:hypothetical protein